MKPIPAGLKNMGSDFIKFSAFNTVADFAMGIHHTPADWFRYVALPNAVMAAGLPTWAFATYMAIDTLASLAPAMYEVGGALKEGARSARISTFSGGPRKMIDTRQAATMRQRALSDISASGMTYRNALSNTGRIYHYRYTRY